MKHFLSVKNDKRLSNIISSSSCLATVAETDITEEVYQLISFMSGINVKDKHLHIQMSFELETSVLENITINFNMVVYHLSSGVYEFNKLRNKFSNAYYLVGKKSRTKYLCPVLGKAYAEIHPVKCPSKLQQPNGKILSVSFIGPEPYIRYNPFGGSDPLVLQMLAKKYDFLTNLVPERAFDVTKVNGTTYGMVHRVRSFKATKENKE